MLNAFLQLLQIQRRLPEFKLANGLTLLYVAGVIASGIALRSLSRDRHTSIRVFGETVGIALWIVGLPQERHAIVWPCMRIVAEDNSECPCSPRQPWTTAFRQNAAQSVTAT